MNSKCLEVSFSSKNDEWETPASVFESLDREFRFTLDPCSTDENAVCEKHYTISEDGLKQDWGGETVFVNPPYSEVARWVKKAYLESMKPKTVVVMLIPARTDTRWFHDFVYHKAKIRFLRGRLRFSNAKNPAPFPSMVVVYE